jgi:hypothetical protein
MELVISSGSLLCWIIFEMPCHYWGFRYSWGPRNGIDIILKCTLQLARAAGSSSCFPFWVAGRGHWWVQLQVVAPCDFLRANLYKTKISRGFFCWKVYAGLERNVVGYRK